MNSTLEEIYYKFPVLLQNLAVSVYGLKLRRERYNRAGRKFAKYLLTTEQLSFEQMKQLQGQLFLNLAKEAVQNVPFYYEWSKQQQLTHEDLKGIEHLESFPIIEKEQVRQNPLDFVNKKYLNNRDTLNLFTSGTTGTPLKVYTNLQARSRHYAFFTRLRSWYDLPEIPRRVTLFGRIIMSSKVSRAPFWRYDLFNKNLLMSSYHLSYENIKYYVEKIRNFEPQEIFAYPSSLTEIAKYVVDKKLEPIKIPLIITTAEPLLDFQRHLIISAFDTTVINQYGCTEMAFFASECAYGTMHSHPEHGILESLGGTSSVSGQLVSTGLINDVMPLIRYKVGDAVEISDRQCPCGRPFPVIESIEGRVDDLLYLPNGTPLGRLDPVFKGGMGIKEAQIVQNEDSTVDIFIVPDHTFDSNKREWILAEFNKRTGGVLAANLSVVNRIARESNGKFKAVVGKYRPPI